MDDDRLRELYGCQQRVGSLQEKIEAVSGELLGLPYAVSPLTGSVTEQEQLIISLNQFDCVTFIETVLAICLSQSLADFEQTLVNLRYAQGQVEWLDRNHYSIDWIRANQEKGYVVNITPEIGTVTLNRCLSVLPDYPQREHAIRYLPLPRIAECSLDWKTGDLVYFGTTQEDLDVRHVGFLIKDGEDLFLRHSSKGQGGVVNEALTDFLERFGESPGIIIVRPCQQ